MNKYHVIHKNTENNFVFKFFFYILVKNDFSKY